MQCRPPDRSRARRQSADLPRAWRPAGPPAGSVTDDDRCQQAKQYWPIRRASNNFDEKRRRRKQSMSTKQCAIVLFQFYFTHKSRLTDVSAADWRLRQQSALITPADGSRANKVFSGVYVFVCLFVCVFFHTISRKPMQLETPNWTRTWSATNPVNPFILGVKRSRSRGSKKHCQRK